MKRFFSIVLIAVSFGAAFPVPVFGATAEGGGSGSSETKPPPPKFPTKPKEPDYDAIDRKYGINTADDNAEYGDGGLPKDFDKDAYLAECERAKAAYEAECEAYEKAVADWKSRYGDDYPEEAAALQREYDNWKKSTDDSDFDYGDDDIWPPEDDTWGNDNTDASDEKKEDAEAQAQREAGEEAYGEEDWEGVPPELRKSAEKALQSGSYSAMSISSAGSALNTLTALMDTIPGWGETDAALDDIITSLPTEINRMGLQNPSGALLAANEALKKRGVKKPVSNEFRDEDDEEGEEADDGSDDYLTPDQIAALVPLLDELTYDDLEWKTGGKDGSGAKAQGVCITDLEISENGLSFKYMTDLSYWGVEDPHDHSQALACLFVQDNDGKWVGGKFEFISSDRQTRGLANIYDDPDYQFDFTNVPYPAKVAFVIVSADLKRRSNVIIADNWRYRR